MGYKMKVGFCLDVNKKDADSGKHKFFIRLAKEMEKNNIIIDDNNPDVYIFLAGMKPYKKAKLNILRLDGLIMNTRWDYKSKNQKILKSIKQSDGVIYQGEFCKDAYNKFLNVDKNPYVIIPNGADSNEFLEREPKDFFLANCKWRPHKRLKEIIKSYLLALEMGLKSDLIVTGKEDYKKEHPKIEYLGWQGYKRLKKLLSNAIGSLHLTWLDWCPNSMVEAIVSGCPIIYTKSGGQTELGEGSGIGIDDTQWEFNLIDLYDPPKINRRKVAEAMIFLENNKNKRYLIREDLDIKMVCKRYIDFLEKC